jgi:hypothetical protein
MRRIKAAFDSQSVAPTSVGSGVKRGRWDKWPTNKSTSSCSINIGAVGQLARRLQIDAHQPQLLPQSADGAVKWVFLPFGMGTAGICPQPGAVIFAGCTPLDQQIRPVKHQNRDGRMAQATAVDFDLFHPAQDPLIPSGDDLIYRHPTFLTQKC